MVVFASISSTAYFVSCFETSDSKTLSVKCISQSDFDLLDFDIDKPRGLASLVLTKRNAASGNEIEMGTEANLIKQSFWAEAEGKIISATELSGNHRNRMYCLSQNENSCCSSVEKPANKSIRVKYCCE